MRWSPVEIDRVRGLLHVCIGANYAIGYKDKNGRWIVRGKPGFDEVPHQTGVDCSGLSRWVIGQGRDEAGRQIILPHGSVAQILACQAIATKPLPLDLGFADLSGSDNKPDHVVIVYDENTVIEARGDPYGKVIRRPIIKWEDQKGFLGFWSVPGIRYGR